MQFAVAAQRSRSTEGRSAGADEERRKAARAAKGAPAAAVAVAEPPDSVPREIIIEVDGAVTEAQAIALANGSV